MQLMNLIIHHNPTIITTSLFEVDFDSLGSLNLTNENLMPFFEIRSSNYWSDLSYNHSIFDRYINTTFNLVTYTETSK